MTKVVKKEIIIMITMLVILFVGQFANTVEAAVTDDYLAREVKWSLDKCTAKTQPYGAGKPYYAVATVFLYNSSGVCVISNSHEQTVAGANATAEARHLSVDKARAYHYITSKSSGEGTSYGYVYEDLNKGVDL